MSKEAPGPLKVAWGDYKVPALEGVHGKILFDGPLGRAFATIDDGMVKLAPSGDNPDAVMRSDIPGELLRLVSGEHNLVTALLQSHAEADGNLMLLVQVAGAMPDLGRLHVTDAPSAGRG